MQFYPGILIHMRGVYPSHIYKARGIIEQLSANIFWQTKGKLDKLVLERLNFVVDIVRGGNCRKRAVFKNLVGRIVYKGPVK